MQRTQWQYFFLPLQGLHMHPRNGFWTNFWQANCFELKSSQHSVNSGGILSIHLVGYLHTMYNFTSAVLNVLFISFAYQLNDDWRNAFCGFLDVFQLLKLSNFTLVRVLTTHFIFAFLSYSYSILKMAQFSHLIC